ncbi:MAG TPA: alpha/beta hydrolase [Acidimicrobiales bacterium]|nr:alpha/beta hydrolase [Acidimicrobiales bacterium]
MAWQSPLVADWEQRGTYRTFEGLKTFVIDVPAAGTETLEPLVIVHGFPSSSFDYHHVVDALAEHRRVLLFDMIGYGLSAKPDRPYSVDLQADVAQAVVADVGVSSLALLTHDLGDTVGGELLARHAEGRWPVEITRRVITNGSIYIEMAHLSTGQQLLLSLADERLPDTAGIDGATMQASLSATFATGSRVADSDLAGEWELISHDGGHLLLPRTIRYIEERRRNQARFTGAIETHPSPLAIVWGTEDPIAVAPMASRLREARPDSTLTWLHDVGHYPMIEAPATFLEAVIPALH